MRNSITRWSPESGYLAGRDPLFRFMEGVFNDRFANGEDVSNRSWMPAVDICEKEDAYQVYAELPGLTKDDIEITLENNLLKLSGERRFDNEDNRNNFHRIERSYGSFVRTFALPSRVDSERVEASFADGILTITVPKAEEARPRRISIS